jgi:hypothetical protein
MTEAKVEALARILFAEDCKATGPGHWGGPSEHDSAPGLTENGREGFRNMARHVLGLIEKAEADCGSLHRATKTVEAQRDAWEAAYNVAAHRAGECAAERDAMAAKVRALVAASDWLAKNLDEYEDDVDYPGSYDVGIMKAWRRALADLPAAIRARVPGEGT